MIDEKAFQRVAGRIDAYRREMIGLQIALTAVPAIAPENGGDGEAAKAEMLRAYLAQRHLGEIEVITAPDDRVSSGGRPNLILRRPGDDAVRHTWIISHLDIVPPGEAGLWDADPYRAYVRDGRLYGRGTVDNQQDLVASLFAFRACHEEGAPTSRAPGLIFVADEETASRYGLDYLLRHPRNPIRRTDLICVPDSGNETGDLIEVAEKSILWVRFRTLGKQCHGSKPHLGKNAFLAASHLTVRLHSLLPQRFPASDPLFDPPESTFEPTRKDANVPNVNTIPGEDNFYMDCRILPRYELESVKAAMNETARVVEHELGVTIEIVPVQEVQAPPATDSDAPIVLALQEAIAAVYGVQAEPRGIGAGTVAAYLRQRDYPAAVWCRTTPMAHQPNEFCLIDDMVGNAKVFAHLFLQE
ncbi:MAG: M20 family metallo-hydrolase [Pseudomonadota bacterium]|nr:M20 family metallo-hydrolase [Pseudomonadota bacterium]